MFCTRRTNQGGVVIIMTLVILVIGAVLAVTFATSMRLEEKSAVAFKKEGKVSNIAQAGYEYALAVLRADNNEYDALNETWRTTFSPVGDEVNPEQNFVDLDGVDNNGVQSSINNEVRGDARWIYLHSDPTDTSSKLLGRFAVLIVDEASKINLHASGSGAQNQGWTPFEIDLTNLNNPNPPWTKLFNATTAVRLINYRQGDKVGEGENTRYPGNQATDDDRDNAHLVKDGIDNDGDTGIDEPNEGEDELDEYVSRIPYGTGDEADFGLKTVDELFKIKGIGKTTMRMCKNFTTVDGQDKEKYWDGSAWQDKLNINAVSSANVDDLYGLMTDAGISPENAARRTTNIIDYADRDNVPTLILTTEPKTYLGIEGLQINEIMAKVHPEAYPVELDSWDDPGQDRWNDPNFIGAGWNNVGYVAQGQSEGETSTWTWPWENGTYNIRIYRNSWGGGTGEDFAYDFQDGQKTGTTTFGSNIYFLVEGVIISTDEIKLTLTAVTGGEKSQFDKIGVVAGQYVELINLSPQPITIDGDWGINVGGDIVIDAETNTAKIVSGTGTTRKFTWFEGDTATFTIPGSPGWPNWSYFIASDSCYALDYKFSEHKDGDWGPPDESGELAVIDQLNIPDGGANISLIREVNDEEIVVDFVPCTATVSGFGTSAWDIVSPGTDHSFEKRVALQDDSLWALCGNIGTPGLTNSSYADVSGFVKDKPFSSPGFVTDVYTGTDKDTKITHTDVRDFIQKLTTAYHRLEVENCDTPPAGWSEEPTGGMDGTRLYTAPTSSSNAALTWSNLHIPDGDYNLFIAGGIGGKFECPSGTARAMRPDGLVYCGTVTITNRILNIGQVFGDGSNKYSLDYILLIPNKDSPPSIGRININTATEQVLNALPPAAFATGGHIIDHRNGADNKDGTSDDNPFKSIGEYLDITGYGPTGDPLLVEAYQKQANLLTVRSDIFEIIVLGQAIDDLVNLGEFDHPEIVGVTAVSDEIIGQEKIRAIVDRSVDPPKLLYFRRELK